MKETIDLFEGKEYGSLQALRTAMPYVVFPNEISGNALNSLGVTVQEREIIPDTAQLAAIVRRRRDMLLRATDYYLMPDYPSTAESLETVKAYRTELRDITEQEGFPETVVWPELPEVLKDAE